MQYFVHGIDDAAVDEKLEALAEQHWSYMDRHADRLVARGPMLSPDGETHTGSVHVFEAATRDQARRFAFQEPYWLAGVYASVTITPMQNALPGTMWDRPAAPPGAESTLVVMTWPGEPWMPGADGPREMLAMIRAQSRLVFGGVLLSDDSTQSIGLVVALDLDRAQVRSIVTSLAAPGGVATTLLSRWQRGGRQG